MKNSGVISILADAQLYGLLLHYKPNLVLLAFLKNLTNVLG
jgi:hypothetical protein